MDRSCDSQDPEFADMDRSCDSQDPEFALDPKMKGVDTLTLSYTFFKVDEEKGDLIGQATAQAAAANIPTIQDPRINK
eukprot:1192900-Prorocentrum_minimum.AAC.2